MPYARRATTETHPAGAACVARRIKARGSHGARSGRLLLVVVLLGLTPLLQAEQASPEKLEKLRNRIDDLQQELSADRDKRDSVRQQLSSTEKRISAVTARQRQLRGRIEDTRQRLQKLSRQQDKLARQKQKQINWLIRTAQASYRSGRQTRLKLVLNQQNPEKLARLLRYQDYFQRSRSKRVKKLNKDLAGLRELTHKVNEARDELADQRASAEEQKAQLQDARSERQQTLARLNKELEEGEQQLQRMRADAKRLRRLLDDMQNSISDIGAQPGGKPFGKLANKLPWPVDGAIRVDYGDTRQGRFQSQGVILKAQQGESVRAIQGGRVLYSDWLRGYGLLTIVDHGDGYLTLYGYNQTLLRDVGEWLSTGDVLALAGHSGGQERNGVYFEVRHNGDPVDPDRWCNGRVTLPPIAENK